MHVLQCWMYSTSKTEEVKKVTMKHTNSKKHYTVGIFRLWNMGQRLEEELYSKLMEIAQCAGQTSREQVCFT